jgi:6-pyruvoyltetrahydropterin/6-carboxytetrahydropterin synthase
LKKKYRLIKSFWLACAHSIRGAGKCERIHGHNFKVTVCVEGNALDEQHMLIDYRTLKRTLIEKYDHHLLNDFPEFCFESGGVLPTTERIAEVFFDELDQLCQEKFNRPIVRWVEVQETDEANVRVERVEE